MLPLLLLSPYFNFFGEKKSPPVERNNMMMVKNSQMLYRAKHRRKSPIKKVATIMSSTTQYYNIYVAYTRRPSMAIWKQQPFFSWKKKFDIWHEPKVGNNLWPWIMGTVYLSFHKIEGSFFNARPKYERRHHRSWNISYHDDDESDYSLGRLIFSKIFWIFYLVIRKVHSMLW